MLKANQTAVLNQANVAMVSLRSSEINYFSQFFSNFGTQAALIAGFVIGTITQVPGLNANCHFLWIYLFWITSALTFVSSMHVLICTVFISVYGQGLALRGPTGSMIKAVEGMVIEQNAIVTHFNLTILFLGLNLIGVYGIMMTLPLALISTAFTIMGMVVWFQASLRICNRFKFSTQDDAQELDDDDDDEDDEFEDTIDDEQQQQQSLTIHDDGGEKYKDGKGIILLQGYLSIKCNSPPPSTVTTAGVRAAAAGTDIMSAGGGSGGGASHRNDSDSRHNSWHRKYLVLSKDMLYYYASEEAYQSHTNARTTATAATASTAISMQQYTLLSTDTDSNITNNSSSGQMHTRNDDGSYNIILQPKSMLVLPTDKNKGGTALPVSLASLREQDNNPATSDHTRIWTLRCDTFTEYTKWKNAFTRVSNDCEQSVIIVTKKDTRTKLQGLFKRKQ